MIWREVISRVKKEIKEVNADSHLSNKFVYSKIVSKTGLILQRDSDALKLGSLQDLYQTIKCVEVKEVPAIDEHCSISSDLVLYRTCNKLPDLYSDFNGVIIKSIRSLDRFGKDLSLESLDYIINIRNDSNSKYDKSVYGFYEDGYIYLEKKVPIRIEGLFTYDISDYKDCDCSTEDIPCRRFLDSKWYVPKKNEDIIISLVLQELINGYKKLPEDTTTNKNPNS